MDRLSVDWLADGQSLLVLTAVRNLQARGAYIAQATVEREIIDSGSPPGVALDAVTTVVGAGATGNEDREALVDQIEADHLARGVALRLGAAHERVRRGADPYATLHDLVDDSSTLLAGAGGRREVGTLLPALIRPLIDGAKVPPLVLSVPGAAGELIRVRAGEFALLIGGSGSGKTTLGALLARIAAANGVTVIFVSCELPGTTLLARMVAQALDGWSWDDVLAGRVPPENLAQAIEGAEGLRVLEGAEATLANLCRALGQVKGRALVVIDYIQIFGLGESSGAARDERLRIASLVEELRRCLQATGASGLILSQASRTAARGMRRGEVVGSDTMDAGAETAQLERAAAVTLAIGSMGEVGPDGTAAVTLSIGKNRYGGGDRVIEARWNPASGRWRVDADSKPAAAALAERQAENTETRNNTLRTAVIGLVAESDRPLTRKEIEQKLGKLNLRVRAIDKRQAIDDAISSTTEDGRHPLVEVSGPGRSRPVWTRERAAAAEASRKGVT